ncbi:MAG: hypothetical protein LLF97_03250 [Planctomycetaceae bacterium]|nr:hypothetical protein [Planctomycetaceae bacterium]
MMNKEPTAVYVCPVDHTPLATADAQLITRVNRAIAAGRVKNVAGRLVDQPLGGGLLREDHAWLYPIREGIPVLLADEAIPLDQIGL